MTYYCSFQVSFDSDLMMTLKSAKVKQSPLCSNLIQNVQSLYSMQPGN